MFCFLQRDKGKHGNNEFAYGFTSEAHECEQVYKLKRGMACANGAKR